MYRVFAAVFLCAFLSMVACSDDEVSPSADAGPDADVHLDTSQPDTGDDEESDTAQDDGDTGTTPPDTGADDTSTDDASGEPEADANGGADDAGSEDTGDPDVGDDSDSDLDAGSGADTDVEDSDDVGTDASDDTGETDVGGSEDTGGDTDPYAGRPVGQCTLSSDCPEGAMGPGDCSRSLPGGACIGCGNDTHCPTIASCHVGTCVADCTSTDDCAPGLRCSGANRCVAKSCENGECPVPLFGCSSNGQCARINCSEDSSICPEDTTCVSGICIEDRAL